MGTTVSVDFKNIRKKYNKAAIARGTFYMIDGRMLDDMNQFVPLSKKSSEVHLRDTAKVDAQKNGVIWETPYAQRMFYGNKSWHYTTPNTGPRWDLRAKGLYMNKWIEAFKKGADWS